MPFENVTNTFMFCSNVIECISLVIDDNRYLPLFVPTIELSFHYCDINERNIFTEFAYSMSYMTD